MPTMLIVDDHPATVMLIRSIVAPHAGWKILTAADGVHGTAVVTQHHATLDVVFLDIYLPGLDGRQLYQYIHELAPALPVIGISSDTAALAELATLGDVAVLPKPLRRIDVLATLDRVLTHHKHLPHPMSVQALSAIGNIDRSVVPTADLQDLDLGAVERHIIGAITHRDYDGPTDPVTFLLAHDGATIVDGTVRPTYAGMLMFAPHPERWIVGSGVDIAQFSTSSPSSDTIIFRQTIVGPIPHVVTRVLDVLWALITHHTRIDQGLERIEAHAYPRLVLRELTLNALCHRDWAFVGATIQVRVFPDRIEWITPGGLPAGVTIANLRAAHVARNSTLAQLLYQAGYIERFGLGMDMVYQLLATAGYVPPSAHDAAGWFTFVVFAARSNTDTAAPALATLDVPSFTLTARQEQIVQVLITHGTLLAQEIADHLALPLRSVQRDLTLLVTHARVHAVGATRSRRYRCEIPLSHDPR